MKTLTLLSLLLSGCAGFKTTFGLAFERDGSRIEGTASFEPTGKQSVRTSNK